MERDEHFFDAMQDTRWRAACAWMRDVNDFRVHWVERIRGPRGCNRVCADTGNHTCYLFYHARSMYPYWIYRIHNRTQQLAKGTFRNQIDRGHVSTEWRYMGNVDSAVRRGKAPGLNWSMYPKYRDPNPGGYDYLQ